MEAQTSASERYRTDSTDWATRSNTMQQNITSLEQQKTSYQKSMDSLRTSSMTYQKRWDNIQSTYTQAATSTEQLHQEIHTAIDQYVEASNVESRNGRIYVNLPEKMLFNQGSSTLSPKGKQALDKLAAVLASNENVDVDIIATAAYYNNGNATTGMNTPTSSEELQVSGNNNATSATGTTPSNKNKNAVTDKSSQNNQSNNETANTNNDSASNSATASASTRANVGDSSYSGSGSVTSKTTPQDPNKKKSTAKSSTTKKSTSTASTPKKNQGDKSISFKSSPKSSKTKATASTAPSWNLNVARSTSIVRELTQNGLPQARIVLAGQSGKGMTTNEWASTNRGYQIVVSPKMDHYQMMQQGQGSTSMK